VLARATGEILDWPAVVLSRSGTLSPPEVNKDKNAPSSLDDLARAGSTGVAEPDMAAKTML
jgi:hypothetical protein